MAADGMSACENNWPRLTPVHAEDNELFNRLLQSDPFAPVDEFPLHEYGAAGVASYHSTAEDSTQMTAPMETGRQQTAGDATQTAASTQTTAPMEAGRQQTAGDATQTAASSMKEGLQHFSLATGIVLSFAETVRVASTDGDFEFSAEDLQGIDTSMQSILSSLSTLKNSVQKARERMTTLGKRKAMDEGGGAGAAEAGVDAGSDASAAGDARSGLTSVRIPRGKADGRGMTGTSKRRTQVVLPDFKMEGIEQMSTNMTDVEQRQIFIARLQADLNEIKSKMQSTIYSKQKCPDKHVSTKIRSPLFLVRVYCVRKVVEDMVDLYTNARNIGDAYHKIKQYLKTKSNGYRAQIQEHCNEMAKCLDKTDDSEGPNVKTVPNILNGTWCTDLWLGNYCGFDSIRRLPEFEAYGEDVKGHVVCFLWFMWFKYGTTDAQRTSPLTRLNVETKEGVLTYRSQLDNTHDIGAMIQERKQGISAHYRALQANKLFNVRFRPF